MITRPRAVLAGLLLLGVALGPRCATTPQPETLAVTAPHPNPLPKGERERDAPHPTPLPAAAESAKGASPSTDAFRSAVRPVLSTRCAPCHEPGGQMYARLPFDDPKTVSENSTAMLRRLKGDDRAALERWVAGLAAATPAR